MNLTRTDVDYTVKSDLARLCLPAARRDAGKQMAWMNSVCLIFLAIGVFGKPPRVHINPPAQTEEIVAAMLEPPILLPQTAVQALTPDPDVPPEHAETTQVVVVTPDSPRIQFAVPTIGNLVAPVALSAAPPLAPGKAPAAAVRIASAKPVVPLVNTGLGGERPQPPYPQTAIERNVEGTVVLLLTADAVGNVTAIESKECTCHSILTRSTIDFIRRRWILPPGDGTRLFQVSITYRLTSG